MFNPPKQNYLFSRDPLLRVLFENKDVVISHQKEKKYTKLLAHIIDDIIYDFEDDPDIINELKQYDTKLKTNNTLIPNVTTYENDIKNVGRFTVETIDVLNDYDETEINYADSDNSDTDDIIESVLNDIANKTECRYQYIENALHKKFQLWNIIIPIYPIVPDGVKCSVEENTYYYDYNTKTINFGFGIMLRNGGLFIEVLPTFDDTETWNTMTTHSPTQILNTFGLNIVDISSSYKDFIVSESIKITFVEITEQPDTQRLGCWSCYDYNKTYPIEVKPLTHNQFDSKHIIKPFNHIKQVIKSLDMKDELNNFTNTEWFDEIPFNVYDNYINSVANSNNTDVENSKKLFKDCIDKLKEYNIKGIRKLDIWTFFKDVQFYAIIKEKNTVSTYPSKEGTHHINQYTPLHNMSNIVSGEEHESDADNEMDESDSNIGINSIPEGWEDIYDHDTFDLY
jgi:hypothetical protein